MYSSRIFGKCLLLTPFRCASPHAWGHALKEILVARAMDCGNYGGCAYLCSYLVSVRGTHARYVSTMF